MPRFSAFSAAVSFFALAAVPSLAQSSLGFTMGEASVGVLSLDSGEFAFADGRVDVAITGAHGLQFDLALEDRPQGTLGHFGAHVYLAPREGQKYGLFATLSDLDGESLTLGAAGAEGRIALGERAALELRAGAGLGNRIASDASLDFIFAGAGVDYEASDRLRLGLYGEAAEFDEADFRAVGYTLVAEAEYRLGSVTISGAVGVSGLEGRDGGARESFARIGLSVGFGAGGADPSRRLFRRADPTQPLALRGLF
jgi:hypothetical protein